MSIGDRRIAKNRSQTAAQTARQTMDATLKKVDLSPVY